MTRSTDTLIVHDPAAQDAALALVKEGGYSWQVLVGTVPVSTLGRARGDRLIAKVRKAGIMISEISGPRGARILVLGTKVAACEVCEQLAPVIVASGEHLCGSCARAMYGEVEAEG